MDDWRLDKFEVEGKRNWNENTIHYKGKIRFINDDFESFCLNLDDKTTIEILKCIAPDIAFATSRLTERLWKNINVKIDEITTNEIH